MRTSNQKSEERHNKADLAPARAPLKTHRTYSRLGYLTVAAATLTTLGRHIFWDTRLPRSPHRTAFAAQGPYYPGEAEMAIYCDGKGLALPGTLNTGHCAVALRGNAHLPWVVYETGNDERYKLCSGTMEQHFTGAWTPFDDATISRTQRITPTQFNTATKALAHYQKLNNSHNAWTIIHNCATFAQTLWEKATNERLPTQYLPFCSPKLLAQAILKQNESNA